MRRERYTKREIEEIKKRAALFKIKNFWRLPCLWRGHKVASRNPDSKVRNMSTITTCFPLSSGRWVYLVYAYPLSIIHRLLAGLLEWATEKYCIKVVNPKKWKEAFIKNSFIPIIPVDIGNVVAMPYISNGNLLDILTGKIGSYSFAKKQEMLIKAVMVINGMHAKDIVWGELTVYNIIRAQGGEIIICDTETVYYRGSLTERKASDLFDFICSACGSISGLHPEKIDSLIEIIWRAYADCSVKENLRKRCGRKTTFFHRLCSLYTKFRLVCAPELYEGIKNKIHSL